MFVKKNEMDKKIYMNFDINAYLLRTFQYIRQTE